MKKYLLLIIALCYTVMTNAQGTDKLSAILQHGNDVSVYDGATGFQQAYAAAADGDVIILSQGVFQTVSRIEKSITIYGAGVENNEEANTAITAFNGNVFVGKADATIDGFRMEGVKVNGGIQFDYQVKNATVKRCFTTGNLTFKKNSENVILMQCYINNNVEGTKDIVLDGLLIANCYVGGNINYFSPNSSVKIDHSFMKNQYNTYNDYDNYNLYAHFLWTNSIIYKDGPNYRMPTGNYAIVKHCIVVNGGGTIRDNNVVENCHYVDLANLFADAEDGNYSEARTFKLQDEETYKGNDGTPIGPSGGAGWNKVPSRPYVSNLSATPSGTNLNVTYETNVK